MKAVVDLEQAFIKQVTRLFGLVEAYYYGLEQERDMIAREIKAFSIDVDFSKMFEEITTNLDEPMSEKQRERYCFSLITPFEAFSRATYPKRVIEQSKESISMLQGLEGAETMIKMYERQIKEAGEKEQRYFDMAFTAEALATTDEMECAYRDLAWKINQYANMLDGAFLMYGLDLKRLQNMCGVWVKQDWFDRAFKVSCYVGSECLAEEYIKRLPQEPQKEPQGSDNSNTLIVVPREPQQAAQGQQMGNSEPQQPKTLQDLLPEQLRTDEALKIFQRAIDANLIAITNNGLKWHKSKALLAYFMGHFLINGVFCDKEYSNLFGEQRLGQAYYRLADNKHGGGKPRGYKEIDCLFE